MTAGVGRVRNLAFLSILMLLKPLLHLSYFTGVLCVNRVFPQPAKDFMVEE